MPKQSDNHPSQPIVSAASQPVGWVKFHRELLTKPIWHTTTPEQKVILQVLLMKANYKAMTWVHKGITYHLKPGQMITSLAAIAQMCGPGITSHNVRSALLKFEKYGFLTNQSTNRSRLITIENWAAYQTTEAEATSQPPNQAQSTHKAAAGTGATNKKLSSEEGEEVKHPLQPSAAAAEAKPNTTPGETAQETPPCPYQQIIDLYHQLCPSLSPITKINKSRKQILSAHWREHQADLGFFRELFTKAQASQYLKGKNPAKWRATFDWIITEKNMSRILEGNYDHLLEKPTTPTHYQPSLTGFHLPESRGKNYTNDQLEALLLNRKTKGGGHHEPTPAAQPGR